MFLGVSYIKRGFVSNKQPRSGIKAFSGELYTGGQNKLDSKIVCIMYFRIIIGKATLNYLNCTDKNEIARCI